ncbi:riboflavin synthase, partial [bacterium]|nr:riboflavin synthase [bacterium]
MFTGVIRHKGTVTRRAGNRLEVGCPSLRPELAHGGSVAVNGACLTVAELAGDGFAAYLLADTIKDT